jgi:hypothetical protein
VADLIGGYLIVVVLLLQRLLNGEQDGPGDASSICRCRSG